MEQFCEIILNLDQWFRRRVLLKIFLIWSSGSQWFRRICRLKDFLSGALAPLVYSGANHYAILKRASWKFGPVVQEEMSCKENVYG